MRKTDRDPEENTSHGVRSGHWQFISAILFLLLASCSSGPGTENGKIAGMDYYYTCPMHPSVISDKPGACPICNMELVRKEVKEADDHSNMLHLTPRQERVLGVETDSAGTGKVETMKVFTGTIIPDPSGRTTLSARINGRLEKLFTREPLTYVRQGEALYSLYSEELNADVMEYRALLAGQSAEGDREVPAMVKQAEQKLLLWGLTPGQIRAAATGNAKIDYIFYSESSGVVEEILIKEGDYVSTGQPLLQLTGLSSVWIEVTGYPGETVTGETALISIPYSGALPVEARRTIKVPAVRNGQTGPILFSAENPENRLIPGMRVNVSIPGASQGSIVVPRKAVIPGTMETIWVKTGKGMYEPRMVKTGEGSRDSVAIIFGLAPGDLVVTRGAYLLNSEYILQKGAGQVHQH